MAGTLAFYSGMMPGITKAVSSIAGDEAAQRGFRQAAASEANIAQAAKDTVEARLKAQGYNDSMTGSMDYVAGKHGLTAADILRYQRYANNRMNPDDAPVTPSDVQRLAPALRDLGAMRGGQFQHIGGYEQGIAKAPGEAAESAIKGGMADAFLQNGPGNLPYKTAAELLQAGNQALGRGKEDALPSGVREALWYMNADPRAQAAMRAIKQMGQSPGPVVNNFSSGFRDVVDPKTGKVMTYNVGKDNQMIPLGEAPPPANAGAPLSNIGKMLKDIENGNLGKKPTTSGW